MDELSLDHEVWSPHNLKTKGLYAYAEKCEIMLTGYSIDRQPVQLVDLFQDNLPDKVIRALTDKRVIKKAFNAAYEIEVTRRAWGLDIDPRQWRCTMVRSTMCGMPSSLEAAAMVLGVENQKDTSGLELIRYFCMPCKPTKANGYRTRNYPHHDPEKWARFKRYCRIDVKAEQDVDAALDFYQIPEVEQSYWILDQIIANNGVGVDKNFVDNAIALDRGFRERLLAEATQISELSNPNSAAQLKAWLSVEMDEEITQLRKADLPALLARSKNPAVKRIINIRQDLAKTSVRKYTTMSNMRCTDGRIRGLIQYYGAARTGRAAGRGVQVHNLPRGNIKDIRLARRFASLGDSPFLEMLYGPIPDTLSSLIRSAFVPAEGMEFGISDFSAIEARVLAWLAGEQWRLDLFNDPKGLDIYKASASKMFRVAYDLIDDFLRQRGKVAELAFGFGGGINAATTMDTAKILKQEEKQPMVDAWREGNPAIKKYWKRVENQAKAAMEHRARTTLPYGIAFEYKRGYLFITLPSGRKLSYPYAQIKPGKKWGTRIVYKGMLQSAKKWAEIDTYGGKLVENIVQAVARDCLYYGLMQLHKAGYKIVMHVHDEAVIEGKNLDIKEINRIFATPAPWAEGLPLAAAGDISLFYKK